MNHIVRVGVIGTTWYAETHLRNLQSHEHAVLTAIAGRDRSRATEVADRFAIPHVFTDAEDLIDSGLIDALVIVAPDELHHPLAMRAFEAGLHVLCEKPLASSAALAAEMHERASASGLVNMSFFALRTSLHHRYVRRLIDEGYLGRIYSGEFSLTHGFFRDDAYQWRFDASRGSGALGDLGCYLFDQARWYIGEIDRISAHLASHVARRHPDGTPFAPANDSAIAMAEFANGAHATFTANVVSHQAERMQNNTIVLNGERGTLELRHTFAGAKLFGAAADDTRFRELEIPEDLRAPLGPDELERSSKVHSVGDRAFIDAILAGGAVEPSFSDGWRVQQIIEAAFASARSGRWETVETREDSA